jgi:hypothetical protein
MTNTHQTPDRHPSRRKRDVVKWCSLSLLVLCVIAWGWSSTRVCGYERDRFSVLLSRAKVYLILDPFYRQSPLTGSGFFFASERSLDLGLAMPVLDVSRIHVDDEDAVVEPRYDGSDHWTADIMLPMWMITLPLALTTAWLWYRARPAIPPGHCAKCGYDLRRLESARCPECGTPFRAPPLPAEPRDLPPTLPSTRPPGSLDDSRP